MFRPAAQRQQASTSTSAASTARASTSTSLLGTTRQPQIGEAITAELVSYRMCHLPLLQYQNALRDPLQTKAQRAAQQKQLEHLWAAMKTSAANLFRKNICCPRCGTTPFDEHTHHGFTQEVADLWLDLQGLLSIPPNDIDQDYLNVYMQKFIEVETRYILGRDGNPC